LILLGLLLVALVAAAAVFGPKLLDSGDDQVPVPSVVGMTQDQATRTIEGVENGELTVEAETEASDTVEKGRVISQSPDADATVDPGSVVTIVVSAGKPDVQIPDVLGDNKDSAKDQLVALGLRVKFKAEESDETKDDVIAVNPDVGSMVPANSVVTLTIAKGPKEVPDVVGMTEERAKKTLEDLGFKVDSLPDNASTEPKGTVTQQSPQKGTPLSADSTVTILVSTYEAPPPITETPEPTDTPTITP
jgi:eukaryotic-like serine/threonine-protein kinase